jgi:hypothetical protein
MHSRGGSHRQAPPPTSASHSGCPQRAGDIGCTPAQVALAWLVRPPGSVIPIIGARRAEQLDDNLGCLNIELAAGHLERLDKASHADRGFPHDFIASIAILDQVHGNTYPRLTARPRWGG